MSDKEPIPTWFFVVVVARLGRRFLMIRERKHGQLWYLPAGRVHAGEALMTAAVRETLEESGVPVVLEGVLEVQHTPMPRESGSRCRFVFLARPADDSEPGPTEDSLDAAWLTLEEIQRLPLRGPDAAQFCSYVSNGGPIYPLSLLGTEG